jgi:plasmid maintenance system killer protein
LAKISPHTRWYAEREPGFLGYSRSISAITASHGAMKKLADRTHVTILRIGDTKRYTVHVNGPWCITFEFDDGDALRVDFEQYH